MSEIAASIPKASQTAAEAGVINHGYMTPLRVKQAIDALAAAAGGGAPALKLAAMAWVNEEEGDDATGDGSPEAPFETAQQAYNNSFRAFAILGNGGSLVVTENIDLIGFGRHMSRLNGISAQGNAVTLIRGNGREMMRIINNVVVTNTGGADATGETGDHGEAAPAVMDAVVIEGLVIGGDASVFGGTGGAGAVGGTPELNEEGNGSTGGNGGNGGTGGQCAQLTVKNCFVYGDCRVRGGAGGQGGNGGVGGAAGVGYYGGDGGPGGDGGRGVESNYVILEDTVCLGLADSSPGPGGAPGGGGVGGAGSEGNGNQGADGTTGPDGSAGDVRLLHSRVGTAPADAASVSALASVISSTFYGNSYP